ncbi:bifunctional 4-hydroxy-2-oxoglutarate aldolase/2-dehydro-3-deoxy-phosphogluconate aldolase [Lederbergia citrea]|uniref:bifunctional 4-hydroxy-2-oxoglutarate aldolase/2-dehydro-3-deoxy-phosphogluconate aldolase n=1 Tax=Lederbergia citrea TaxID=2833581 RepID=UPI001BC8EECF|nr:bifunctional 4-hydroxy-2-oxoglutarate aldolase/2-dehydro-3-deoxy-phosphogluconate aldolase [Lederbergia citrea]MBS4202688.1 bifunctional 4-hydroxy-2-oxoglutarate aldolase/2-dehydro-3-deoxy-phosphogluconate aldolase [Lederbergia citrea]
MKLIELVKREKIVVIVRGIKPEDSLSVAEALVAGGIRFIEVTMNTEGALAIIQQWRECFKNEEIFIGAGTVLDREMATAAIEAGAQFIVTPNLDEEVVKLSCEKNIDIFPGVMTPTEIVKALKAGAKAVKLFPMGSLGLNYLKEIRAPLSDVQILATGGVNLENIQEYLKNGVIGVGIGSNIIDKKLIEEKNFQGITELARKYKEAVKDVEKYG